MLYSRNAVRLSGRVRRALSKVLSRRKGNATESTDHYLLPWDKYTKYFLISVSPKRKQVTAYQRPLDPSQQRLLHLKLQRL